MIDLLRPELLPYHCSRTGCQRAATVQLLWRNPKIHSEDRVKTWLSCAEHEEYLRNFLQLRGFLLSVEPVPSESENRQ